MSDHPWKSSTVMSLQPAAIASRRTSGHVADGHKPSTTTHSYTSTLPSLGLPLLPGPLALTLPRPDITVFFFSVSKNLTPQSPPFTVTPASNLPNINQMCVNYCIQLFVYYQLRYTVLFLNWYHCRSRGFYTVSKVWNIVFAIVGCCVLTFVNNTQTIHSFVGRYSLSVKEMCLTAYCVETTWNVWMAWPQIPMLC